MPGKTRLRYSRMMRSIRRRFLAGLLVLVPMAATILILAWFFNFVDNLVDPLVRVAFRRDVPGVGFVVVLLLIYFAGLVTANVLGRTMLRWGEYLVARIPIMKDVYNTIRQIVYSLALSNKGSFRDVLLVEFPRAGMFAVGFVTNSVNDSNGRALLAVYIPTSPNPTSGFLVMIPAEGAVYLNMQVESAMKMVVSAGLAAPPVIGLSPAQCP